MSTYYSEAVKSGVRLDSTSPPGIVLARSATFTIAASGGDATALAQNDVIEMVPVPKGAQIVDILTQWSDLDSAGAPTMDVGDGDDPNGYFENLDITTAGRAHLASSTVVNYSIGKEYAENDTIDVKIMDASPNATSGTINMVVLYKKEGGIADET